MFNVTDSKRIGLTNTILSELDFHSAKVKTLQFWQSKFLKEVDFSYSSFNSSPHFIEIKFSKISFFNYVRFERPEDIIFQRVDLSKVSLVNTDLTRINFGKGIQFGEEDEFTTFDEIRLIQANRYVNENKRSKINLGNVLGLYRGLRENYEFRLRYDESSYFFIKEMELKRKYKEIKES